MFSHYTRPELNKINIPVHNHNIAHRSVNMQPSEHAVSVSQKPVTFRNTWVFYNVAEMFSQAF